MAYKSQQDRKQYQKTYEIEHAAAIAARKKEYRTNNKESYNLKGRWRTIKRKYGLTEKDWNDMFSSQEGRCAICRTHQQDLKEPLYVDHDHATGKVRGLLCGTCNTGIGMLKDSIEILEQAVSYIKESNK